MLQAASRAAKILLDGQRIDQLPPAAMRSIRGKRIGMVFQDSLTSLDPLYRIGTQIEETIAAHTDLRGEAVRRRVISLLAEVGIAAPEIRMDSYPRQFSGGMRQRLVLALALAAEPHLVVADEPTTALDVSVQAQIITLMKRLAQNHHVAIMLITHDMGVIADAADRVAVMYAGRIVEIGPVQDVVHTPRHPYSQGLMGSIPRLDQGEGRLVAIPGAMPRLDAIPPGCAFHPRCPHAFARCIAEKPSLQPTGAGAAACLLFDVTDGAA
jgi:peptide/nickel transport system ATP-binding protein